MSVVERVGFKQVYDLVFRAKNARLSSVAYVLDFYDWLKAGIAFNTRGFEVSTRKISYFVKLYEVLTESRANGVEVLQKEQVMFATALSYYYADIFEIYQDHVKSKHSEAAQRNRNSRSNSRIRPEFGNLLVLPAFDCVPELREVFPVHTFEWDKYQCKDPAKFSSVVASTYVKPGTGLFSCMSMMFDYGIGHVEDGVLLEVSLWDENN